MKYVYEGTTYSDPDKLLMAEILHLEKVFSKDMEDFSVTDTLMANLYIAVRRVDPKLLPAEKFLQLAFDDVEFIKEEPPPEPEYVPDPTEAVSPTALSGSSSFPEPVPS
jgi:hypothetical protein